MAHSSPFRISRLSKLELPHASVSQVSVLTWNVLAQCYVSDNRLRYQHVDRSALQWDVRSELIAEELIGAMADVVLLQEVAFTAFEEDFEPRLASMGYTCVMQEDRRRQAEHQTGNATFFREDRFELIWQDHRSRVLMVALRERSTGLELVIGNAHLEGNPQKCMDRVQQVRSALQQASRRCTQHALLICGDFNAPLHSSAVASYLSFGSVLPGVVEFGREVTGGAVASHSYSLQSAYTPNSEDFSFTTRGSSSFCGMLDQMWFDIEGLRCLAVREPFRSQTHRGEVLSRGLPSHADPSDHLPLGAVFELLQPPPPLRAPREIEASLGAQAPGADASELAAEAELLWQNSTLSEVEKAAWLAAQDAVTSATPAPGQKPSAEELEALQSAQAARKDLLESFGAEQREELQVLTDLQKRSRKLRGKQAKKSK